MSRDCRTFDSTKHPFAVVLLDLVQLLGSTQSRSAGRPGCSDDQGRDDIQELTNEDHEQTRPDDSGIEALLSHDEGGEGPQHERHEESREDRLAHPFVGQPQLLQHSKDLLDDILGLFLFPTQSALLRQRFSRTDVHLQCDITAICCLRIQFCVMTLGQSSVGADAGMWTRSNTATNSDCIWYIFTGLFSCPARRS